MHFANLQNFDAYERCESLLKRNITRIGPQDDKGAGSEISDDMNLFI